MILSRIRPHSFFRRNSILNMNNITLMLDKDSNFKNEKSKYTKMMTETETQVETKNINSKVNQNKSVINDINDINNIYDVELFEVPKSDESNKSEKKEYNDIFLL
jgi:hypothetical protein